MSKLCIIAQTVQGSGGSIIVQRGQLAELRSSEQGANEEEAILEMGVPIAVPWNAVVQVESLRKQLEGSPHYILASTDLRGPHISLLELSWRDPKVVAINLNRFLRDLKTKYEVFRMEVLDEDGEEEDFRWCKIFFRLGNKWAELHEM